MKLERITLRDFQAHRRLVLECDPRTTTIRGPTDAGKSAILRALRWAALNDLAGSDFIREGARIVKVGLRIDRHRVVRVKGPGINSYRLDEEVYRAFGTGVPDPIARLLRLSPLNFQGQHDAPFWFAETAGEVSRQLNAIVDLSVIDTTLANIASAVRRAQERSSLCSERLEQAKRELEEMEPQRQRIQDFARLKDRAGQLEQAQQRVQGLQSILAEVESNRADVLAKRAQEAEAILGAARGMRKLERQEAALTEMIRQIEDLGAKSTPPPDFTQVEKGFAAWRKAAEKEEQLSSLLRRIQEADFARDSLQAAVQTAEEKYHQQTKGQRCPLCGKEME